MEAAAAAAAAAAAVTPAPLSARSLQGLGTDGQKYLEATADAAHEILGSMNEVLCNPALWVAAPPQPTCAVAAGGNADGSVKAEGRGEAEGIAQQEAGWAALDGARLRYKSATAALRAVITAIFSSPQIKQQDGDSVTGAVDKTDPVELERLEQRASELREEICKKNQVLKLLIDQLRDLISDISIWQCTYLM